jgi:hypothetical protein
LINDKGEVLLTAYGPIYHCQNAVTAEALGMLNGIKAILPVYVGPLQIESDNAFLVKELNINTTSKCSIAGIVQDIKISSTSFQELLYSKINRLPNKAADDLAKPGHTVLSECVLLGRAPPCVVESLKRDCIQKEFDSI